MSTTATEAKFLQAIIENPGDDAIRLIYADYLEDRGDEARSSFIRVQVALAKLDDEAMKVAPMALLDTIRPREALRRRERELLRAHDHEWTCGLCSGLTSFDTRDGIRFTFRRGFVAEIICTLADWMGTRCERCDGYTVVEEAWGATAPCLTCYGTGRVGGSGHALVRAAPIERVVLTGKQPARSDPFYFWPHGERAATGRDEYWTMPFALHDLLKPEDATVPGRAWYRTEKTALDALSAAAILWARSQPSPV